MSYCRSSETGSYIWTDGKNMHFNGIEVPEEDINLFLARLYDNRRNELKQRIKKGRKIIESFSKEKKE